VEQLKQEQKQVPVVTIDAPRAEVEKAPRLCVEELEARIAPSALWGE
jgi:hypothetical protein